MYLIFYRAITKDSKLSKTYYPWQDFPYDWIQYEQRGQGQITSLIQVIFHKNHKLDRKGLLDYLTSLPSCQFWVVLCSNLVKFYLSNGRKIICLLLIFFFFFFESKRMDGFLSGLANTSYASTRLIFNFYNCLLFSSFMFLFLSTVILSWGMFPTLWPMFLIPPRYSSCSSIGITLRLSVTISPHCVSALQVLARINVRTTTDCSSCIVGNVYSALQIKII